ncbi:Threonine synthase-like 2 [Frankliniella fusca]|uniref:Threonine synthase-like 2 n=1 Tax=Frankliniella fusca TaxID=407009 RepID=A0AAE1I349_9NEOP|nr:Threonine synthase-like 2 [Frankliniella fusca]
MDVLDVLTLPGERVDSTIFHGGDGYYYHVREVRPRRVRLKCRHLVKHQCEGTGCMFFVDGQLKLQHLQPHSCPRDHMLSEDILARRTVVQEAKSSTSGQSVRKILRDFKLRLQPELACRFTVARMHSALHNARSSNYPKLPKTLIYLGVLLGLPNMRPICTSLDGTDYVFQGVVGLQGAKTVSVVFASGRMLQLLQSQPNLHMDGTFKKRPRKPKCRQIFNIVTNHGGTVVAIVRVLMQSRSENAYFTLFEFLKRLAPGLNPERIHCDFERATINALRRVFPDADIVACLWHFGVCIGRKATKLELAALANSNDLIHNFIRCGFIQLEHLSRCDDNAVHHGCAVQGPPRWRTLSNNRRVQRLTNLLVKDEITPIRFVHEISTVNEGALNHGMRRDVDSGSDSDDD